MTSATYLGYTSVPQTRAPAPIDGYDNFAVKLYPVNSRNRSVVYTYYSGGEHHQDIIAPNNNGECLISIPVGEGYPYASTDEYKVASVAEPKITPFIFNFLSEGSLQGASWWYEDNTVIYDYSLGGPKITSLSIQPNEGFWHIESMGLSAPNGYLTPVVTAEPGFDIGRLSGKLRWSFIPTASEHYADVQLKIDNTGGATFTEISHRYRGEWCFICSTTDGSNLSATISGYFTQMSG